MSEELTRMSATELVEGFRRRRFSPPEAADAVLARMDLLDGNLSAFCHRDDDTVRRMARESEARWNRGEPASLLDGVPVSIKDALRVEGWPTRLGSKTVDADGPWEHESPPVAAMRKAGAVFLGMTKMSELGWKAVTDGPLYGSVHNPWNLRLTPGGSSGGAAAAVASGLGPLAFGSDGGGSVRIPAGFCGIAGLKPSFGRVPVWPPSIFGTLSHVGPMARSVRDAALMLDVIAHPHSRDPWSLPEDGGGAAAATDGGVAGMKIAWSPDLGHVRVDPEIADLVARAVAGLAELGAEIHEIAPPAHKPEETFRTLWYASAAFALRSQSRARRRVLDRGLVAIATEGERLRAVDLLEAERSRGLYAVAMAELFDAHDLLLTPTLPIPAFESGLEVPRDWPHERWFTWAPFSYPFNLTRQPALTVPCGFTSAGLPAGLHIVGPLGADRRVLRAGAAYQRAFSTLETWPAAGRSAPPTANG